MHRALLPVKVPQCEIARAEAQQEVIWGGEGEILTIRHDSLSRSSFMPGVMMSIKKVYEEPRFYYGLEEVIGLTS